MNSLGDSGISTGGANSSAPLGVYSVGSITDASIYIGECSSSLGSGGNSVKDGSLEDSGNTTGAPSDRSLLSSLSSYSSNGTSASFNVSSFSSTVLRRYSLVEIMESSSEPKFLCDLYLLLE